MGNDTWDVARSDPRECTPLVGPEGSFQVSVYFRCAVESSNDLGVETPSTVVPLNQVLVNHGGGGLDSTTHCYVTPLAGPYHFDFCVLLMDAGTGPSANAPVALALEIGSRDPAMPTVQIVCCKTSFSGTRTETKSLSSSATLELLAEQTVRLTLTNEGGNATTFVPNSRDYPLSSCLSAYSLF